MKVQAREGGDHGENIRPFEWLTSPDSIRSLLETYVLAKCDDDDSDPLSVLHVGCGSSTLGEWLVRGPLHERIGRVVNVDNDTETLANMEKRWLSGAGNETARMSFVDFNFCSDDSSGAWEPRSFDVVVDKSTLDCTLCSDQAAARLLCHAYDALNPDVGVYLVISFHPLGLLLPLIRDLPGASWQVETTTMPRQVEWIGNSSHIYEEGDLSVENPVTHNSSREPLLNVIIARRFTNDGGNDTIEGLDVEAVIDHVHNVNNSWFQEQHPLLTRKRADELKDSFGDKYLSLNEAYSVLFTDAEREHLTFEHFLEDWHAFQSEKEGNIEDEGCMSYETGVQFLEAMQ